MLSTLKALFEGEKALFAGLWIEDKHDWEPHPVLHLSIRSLGYRELGLERALLQEIQRIADRYQIPAIRGHIGGLFASFACRFA